MEYNIFKLAKRSLCNSLDRMRRNNKEAHVKALKDGFALQEKNKEIFILHNGVAVSSFTIGEGNDVALIISELEVMRKNAVYYEYRE